MASSRPQQRHHAERMQVGEAGACRDTVRLVLLRDVGRPQLLSLEIPATQQVLRQPDSRLIKARRLELPNKFLACKSSEFGHITLLFLQILSWDVRDSE